MKTQYKNTSANFKIFLGVVFTGSLAMIVATKFDITWTQFAHSHRIMWYSLFMNESLSNGNQLGAVDFVYALIVIPSAILYFLSWFFCLFPHNKQVPFLIEKIISMRPYLGFLVTSAFCSAFLFVHATKQIVGRARPWDVFYSNIPYSEWYELGPLFITQGKFSGSFPSGHTAIASLIITLVYITLDTKRNSKLFSGLLLAFSLVFAGGMGISRMMSASHWATDVIFTVFASWAIIHTIFYWGLKVPTQNDYFRKHKKHYTYKRFFELQICLYMSSLCLGVWAISTGIRSVYMSDWSWLMILSPLGFVTIIFSWEKLWSKGFFRKKLLTEDNTK